MYTAAKKLQSRRGASLIFALLVFMLCAFAGVAALAAAGANSGRYARLEQDQRQYFSVASAAQLLRGQLVGKQAELSITLRETYTWHYDGLPGGYTLNTDTAYTFVGPGGAETEEPMDACGVQLGPLGGAVPALPAVDTMLQTVLEDYLKTSFLCGDVPAYFFDRPAAGGGTTGPRPAASAASEHRFLELAPQGGDDAWRYAVDTVYAEIAPLGDYGLALTVYGAQDGAEDIYRAMFKTTAKVEREITTKQTVEDDPLIGTGGTGVDGTAGRRITETTVTATVTWSTDSPSMTRVR